MEENKELLKSENRDWDGVYSELDLSEIPWHSERPDHELAEMVEAGLVKPHDVLDVGCGAGTDSIYLALKGCKVTAVDVSEEVIKIARERAAKAKVKVDFITEDFFKMEFEEEEEFDFINDRGCFHHIDPEERESFAARIDRVLRKDGCYYLRCWSDKEEESERGPYRISKEEIKDTFSRYFRLEDIRDFRFGGEGALGYVCLMRKKKV